MIDKPDHSETVKINFDQHDITNYSFYVRVSRYIVIDKFTLFLHP